MSSILFDKTHQQVLGVGADINCARARERDRETVSRAPKCVMCVAHIYVPREERPEVRVMLLPSAVSQPCA